MAFQRRIDIRLELTELPGVFQSYGFIKANKISHSLFLQSHIFLVQSFLVNPIFWVFFEIITLLSQVTVILYYIDLSFNLESRIGGCNSFLKSVYKYIWNVIDYSAIDREASTRICGMQLLPCSMVLRWDREQHCFLRACLDRKLMGLRNARQGFRW